MLEFRLDRFMRGGDHCSFNHEGFAAVRFTEWREDFNHQHQNVRVEDGVQYGDLLKYVDFDYVARVARLNAATLAVLDAAPPQPVDVQYPSEHVFNNSINNTQIVWNAGPNAPADTHYEIVWRPTACARLAALHPGRPPQQHPQWQIFHGWHPLLRSRSPSPRTTSSSASALSTPKAIAVRPSFPGQRRGRRAE